MINAVKICVGMTENNDVLKARASKAMQTNSQVITNIRDQVSGVTGIFASGAAEYKEDYMESGAVTYTHLTLPPILLV